MIYKDIPIFIISFNRLNDLSILINRLEKDGYKNIIIVDNASTDEELLAYLKQLKHKVYLLDKNFGHKVVWESKLFDDIVMNSYYVVTDPDVIPTEECPGDYLEFFYSILGKYEDVTKVGFSLKIDDIPLENEKKMDVIRWESFYWEKIICHNPLLFDAQIDTTFALYRPGEITEFYSAIRTGWPYEARHLPWYWNTRELAPQDEFYLKVGNMCGNTYVNSAKVKDLNFGVISKLYYDSRINIENEKVVIYREYSQNHDANYIYGAGEVAVKVKQALDSCGITIDGFIVSSDSTKKIIDDVPVYSINEIKTELVDKNVGIILATSLKYKFEILRTLYSNGLTDICSLEL